MATDFEPLIEAVTDALVSKEIVVTLQAPTKAQVKRPDGSYRTQSLTGSEEFMLKGLRGGKRSDLIFEFVPVDTQPYVQMEMGEKNAFEAFEGFEAEMIALIGREEESWNKAKNGFVKDFKRAKVAEVEEANETNYSDNPLFGAF